VKGSASLIQVVTLQILAVLLAIALVSGLIIVYSLNKEFKTKTQNLRESLISEQKSLLQAEVNRAIDYIRVERSRVIRLAKENLLSETTKLHSQLHRINSALKDENSTHPIFIHNLFVNLVDSYNNQSSIDFSITSTEGVGIHHPKNPKYVGKSLLHIRDAQHTRVINEELGMIRISNEGFLSTFWQDGEHQRQRVSFVKVFKPRNWYIKGSIDLDDFTQELDELIFNHIANRRFGQNSDGYFFINTFAGDVVLSNGKVYDPRPNSWDFQDPNGIYVVQENSLIAQSAPQGGFSEYTWENLDGKLAPKISFVMPIPGRDLFIGAGVDLDYINKAIDIQKDTLQEQITKQIYWIIALFILATSIVSLLMLYLTKRMQGIVNVFFKTFEKAATEQVEIPDESVVFSEFRTLAKSANGLIKTLKSQ
jgi:signal transduction histidine kinase